MSQSIVESPALAGETLVPLKDAGKHFPVPVSKSYLQNAIRKGRGGVRLETIYLAGRRYTSEEAVDRFIARTQYNGERKDPPEPVYTEKKLKDLRKRYRLPEPEGTQG
ncbi:MAG: DUF1580 domain-containing protein [Planctomycetaceae bacterium]|jgi:hypothetical protein|nr:DUF1580 domain-containing protein [Planctomycetaceae bacterium]